MRAALSIGAFVGFLSLFGCGGSGSSSPTPTPGPVATTTVLAATPNPAAAGATVTLTATVTSPSGSSIPTGSVSFSDGTTVLGSATLTASTGTSATAVYTTSSLAAGATHSLTASYAGNGGLQASTSTAVSEVVNAAAPVATTTTLSASPNPAAAGAAVTLTANVSSTGGTPAGTVTFLDGTTTLGTGTLTNGVATFSTSSLAAGATHSLTASYAGSSGFAASASGAVSEVVNAAATTTTLTATPNPAAAGATVTLTATITSGSGTPTGSITFFNGSTNLGTGTLNSSGVATLTTTTLPAGTLSLTALYAGNSSFAASTSAAVSLVVNAAATGTTLTVSPNPAVQGATVTLTATVTASVGTPTGTVTFLDGSTTLGTGTLTNGVATFTTSSLAAGTTHSLTASYAASGSFAASTSAAVSEVVNVATTTALTAGPNPATQGATVTLTATVTSSSGTPTGTVTFLDGTTTLGTGTLASGAATLTTTSLAAGETHSLTASYAASGSFAASTSTAVSLVVSPSDTANATFDFTTPHQTIAGFGGAEAFYANYLDSHPNESQIMSALFDPTNGLGITILRLQNNYYEYNGSNASTFDTDNTKIVQGVTTALGGTKPTILMSSWTPPANLKSNNSIDGCTGVKSGNCTSGFGTLAQVGGAYNYSGFGQFWLSSLQAYAALGVVPDYISIQNEPDFPATYQGCLFNPTETPANLYNGTQSYASYGKAFDATYQAINASGALTSVPKMIGPESFSLNNVQALLTQVPANELAVVAHHLYNVSSNAGNPANQVSPMSTLESDFPTQMKWETEYYQAPGFYNAIDIHNALTVANDNVYLYWALAWPSTPPLVNGQASDQQGLLYIDNPFDTSSWQTANGWTYNDAYYAMKGYSYYIRPGYVRYSATSNNADEDVSVFQSPDAKTTVVVILNVSTTSTDTITLDLSSITYTGSTVYRSSFNTPISGTGSERWNNLGAYTASGISLPPESEVTVVLTQ